MYPDKYNLDRGTRTRVDTKPGLQGAAKPLYQAHPQGFGFAGIVIRWQSDTVVADAQHVITRQPLFKGYVDLSGSVVREGVFHGVGNGFVDDQTQRDSL
jgi:hypothetical protein